MSRPRSADYERTLIDVVLADGQVATVALGADVPSTLHDWLPFHVVTAWNPGSERPGRRLNDAAHRELLSAVGGTGQRVRVAFGRSRDSGHVEVSVAVQGLSDRKALELGRRFGQDAIFAVRASGAQLLWCEQRTPDA